jgi:hypothetical protein
MGFLPSKADPDVWMIRNGDVWEYVAVYVDDLCLALKKPEAFIKRLREEYKYKLKGVSPLTYHLGAEYGRGKDGTLAQGSKRYGEKMMSTYKQFFKEKPKEYASPLEKGDHPELDTSEFVDAEGIAQYQTMVGQCQWEIALGRFEMFPSTMSMSRWQVAPRKVYLERWKRMYDT